MSQDAVLGYTQSSLGSLCHSKVGGNWTGAPGSPKRTWDENDGASAPTIAFAEFRKSIFGSKSIQPDSFQSGNGSS
jgi:hypothetical protein